MYSNKDLRKLLIPLIVEQILSALMGIADTLMVSNVGAAALSGVSLVDTINNLILMAMMALASGGTVVCAQFLGRKDEPSAKKAAGQLLFCCIVASAVPALICMAFAGPLLRLIYGGIEADVMAAATTYFLITAASYLFFGIQQAAASIFRAEGQTRTPMMVSLASNLLNIVGNAVLIFGLHLGVAGAAWATLLSRVVGALVMQVLVSRRDQRKLVIDSPKLLTPEWRLIRMVLKIGVPAGLENGLFQLGKLIVASTVSTLGTAAISAQAMITMVEGIHGYPGQAIGIGLMTVAGTCMGAGKVEETKYYTRKLCIISECSMLIMAAIIAVTLQPIVKIAALTPEAAELFIQIMIISLFTKSIFWVCSFTLPNTLRASGDAAFCSAVSAASMWTFRVGLSFILCRFMGVGLIGVWIGWYIDWVCRDIFYIWRYRSGKWATKTVID